MKKMISLLLALLLAVCALPSLAEEADELAVIQQRGTLNIATEGVWRPWTYHDGETDELIGFDVELGRLIAKGLGVEPVFWETDFTSALSGVETGRFDIVCNGVGYTEERAEKYDFTDIYVYSTTVLVVAASNEDIHTVEDLKGRKAVNSPASTYAQLAEQYGAVMDYVDTLDDTIKQIVSGRDDATINALDSIQDFLMEHPDTPIKIVQTLDKAPVSFPLRKGDRTDSLREKINAILTEARENGTLAALSEKYFGMDLTNPE